MDARELGNLAVAGDEFGVKDLECGGTLGVAGAEDGCGVAVVDEVLDAPTGNGTSAELVEEL